MSLRSLKSAREIVSKLQSGSGAQKLSPQVTKISLAYAFKGKTECAGAKHFLQENLPRMQYNNPDVEFEVFKSADPATKPSVTVHFGERGSKTIDIPTMQSDTICDKVFQASP
ncbi:hypothetical protein RO3G_05511 [Lichtheimia corymbifera JMRC:FSU:9682]|uniref:Ribosomal protein/NADH dehydrogenase domain-containing protein n=1 Tax=Lichtheimia corymbifera JMRC:FSU:9682 TaxID=1263082 RepID=A0A068S9W7_9FUNG|nr:hypothetical protein RO3G_05511 [Lichtheimia corymbifera JMRC:FSU:9682]